MSIKPRVVHCISELEVGGSELSLRKLLPHLQAQFDNHVLCEMGRGAVGEILERADIPVHYLDLPSRFSPLAITRVKKLMHQLKPTAVTGTLIHADIVGRLAARSLRYPFISNQRSSLQGRGYLRLLDFATSRFVNQYVVQTPAARDNLHRSGRIPLSKIAVIPNIVETITPTKPRHQVRTELGIKEPTLVITCVSNLRPGKGQETLLAAFAPIISQLSGVSCQLLLAGAGPEKQKLQQLTQQLGISDYVRFLGLRHDIPNLLAASDMFVLPSEAEGMSNALLEAMTAGLPCIASDIPANQGVIQSEQTGMLFKNRDAQALTSTLTHLIRNEPLRHRLAQSARQHVTNYHAPSIIAGQWATLINQLNERKD